MKTTIPFLRLLCVALALAILVIVCRSVARAEAPPEIKTTLEFELKRAEIRMTITALEKAAIAIDHCAGEQKLNFDTFGKSDPTIAKISVDNMRWLVLAGIDVKFALDHWKLELSVLEKLNAAPKTR